MTISVSYPNPVLTARALVIALLYLVLASGASVANDRLQVTTETGTYDYTVELALTNGERAVGLMHRQWMAPDAGMLFRFDTVQPVSMWMRNTLIPLDMIFIRPDGTVANVHRNAEPLSERIIRSAEPVLFVLELNAGDADRMGLKPGDRIAHPIIKAQ
ncbi:DUF192 domain-containing protein [Nitratireductor sp. XY-223]|uniref:DUF192 domain-containing protein n=1 Tax=Nitratireductor sp. XY-223 TaxID=2561926 RepID=UPI0010AAE8ED|nr:DUF192 domain-containing protein [Nitratireductor sp. XY-223]